MKILYGLRKYVLLIVLLIIFSVLIILSIGVENETSISKLKVSMQIDNNQNSINIYEKNEEYYFLLPSLEYFEDSRLIIPSSIRVKIDNEFVSTNDLISKYDTNKEYEFEVFDLFGRLIKKSIISFYTSNNINSIMISFNGGVLSDVTSQTGNDIHSSHKKKLQGNMTVLNDDATLYTTAGIISFSGRGNSSWSLAKKPFSLKLTEDKDLLDNGHQLSDWVLVANGCDESSLRNKLVYDTASKLGLENTPCAKYINLYIDGDYQGLYLLVEKIEVNQNFLDLNDLYSSTKDINALTLSNYSTFEKTENFIFERAYNIPNNPDDISGGYLLELELAERANNQNNLFVTKNGQAISVKYPPYISEKEMDYISKYVQDIEDRLQDDNLSDISIDLNSWVKYYLVQETFANTSHTSYYFYKDIDSVSNKLFAGPLWDFDLTMGTDYSNIHISSDAFLVNTWGWYYYLYNNANFRTLIISEYKNHMSPLLSEVIENSIDDNVNLISKAWVMDSIKWKGINNFEYCDHYDTLLEHANSIKSFLNDRKLFLDEKW